MALSWKLLDYTSGMVIRSEGLPVSDESAETAHSIHGDETAEIDIVRTGLTADENNNWRETFALLINGAALDDESKEWNDPSAIHMSGFINKLNDDINPRKIKAQVTGLTEYTKARIVADTWSPVSDPTTTVDFTGSNWPEVMASAFTKCFSAAGIPAGKPKPYNILGKIKYPDGTEIVPTGNTVKKSVKVTDAMTYHDLLTSISEEAGGLEWQTVARWTDSTRLQAVVDIIIGTVAVPHINENVTLTLNLAENDAKFSAYSGTFDSNELYSKLYIQSVPGDEETKSGADFTVASVDDTEFPVLFERFFNPGVALTTAERDAQLSARLAFAAKPKYETSITVEEKFDPSEWRAHMGKKLILTGVDNTPSAGHDATVRIVGITSMPEKGTVKAQLMQLGPTYPRLPKDRIQGLTGVTNGNSKPVTMPSFGGGLPVMPAPVVPSPGGFGVDGVLSPSDLWGSEGHNPWDGMPKSITNIQLSNFLEKEYTYEGFLGTFPLDPMTTFADDGNRVYGLDHNNEAVATKFENDGIHANYNGGLNKSTGLPSNGWKPFYIKKTYLLDGELGPLEEVGVVSPETISTMLAPWEDQIYDNGGYYKNGIMASNWVVGGRYYFCLLNKYLHSEVAYYPQTDAERNSVKYIEISKTSIISKSINPSDGKLEGEWKLEDRAAIIPDWLFPVTSLITKFDKNIIFTGGFIAGNTKFKNADTEMIQKYQEPLYAKYNDGGIVPHPFQWGPVPRESYTELKSSAGQLWPSEGNGNYNYLYRSVRKDFGDLSKPYQVATDTDNYASTTSVTSNGWSAIAGRKFRKAGAGSMGEKVITVTPTGAAANFYELDIATAKGNFIYFGAFDIPTRGSAKWGLMYLDAKNPIGQYKEVTNEITSKFLFTSNSNDPYYGVVASNTWSLIAPFRGFWQPGYNNNNEINAMSVSNTFSYDGTLYKFILSGPNKIILHSTRVIEDPNPPAPPAP